MNDIHIVSKERHVAKRWRRYTSYAHTAADGVARLAVPELARACMTMPIGFIADKGGFVPVAIQALEPGRNLLVGQDGRWLAGYVPAVYRSYPFLLGTTEARQPVLCVSEDSGLLSDTEGEPFLDEHGELAPFLKEVLDFMVHVAAQHGATRRICRVLDKHGLVRPWPFERRTDAGMQIIGGLHRVDRTALTRLSADALQEVRHAGALPVIYCQLLSMQHMSRLKRLAHVRAAEQEVSTFAPACDLDLEFLNNGGTLSFGEPARSIMPRNEVYS